MLDKELDLAATTLRAVIDRLPTENVVALHDVDADGVAAGVVFEALLKRLGHPVHLVAPDRERNAWAPTNRRRVEDLHPAFLFVLDLGSRDEKVLEGVPTCFIDHHRPEGVPADDTLISGYEWEPIPNTSWMVYEMGLRMANMESLDWIAAIGTLSDLGDKAPWPLLPLVKKKYGAK